MKKEVLISIKGVQTVDDQKDVTELFTTGDIYIKNNKTYITYMESAVTGFENCRTTLKIDGESKVTLMRSGDSRSHLIMELGRKNTGYYGTPYGQFEVGINTSRLTYDLNGDTGKLYCKYNLDINSSLVSTNEIFIDIKPNRKRAEAKKA